MIFTVSNITFYNKYFLVKFITNLLILPGLSDLFLYWICILRFGIKIRYVHEYVQATSYGVIIKQLRFLTFINTNHKYCHA